VGPLRTIVSQHRFDIGSSLRGSLLATAETRFSLAGENFSPSGKIFDYPRRSSIVAKRCILPRREGSGDPRLPEKFVAGVPQIEECTLAQVR